MAEVPKPEMPKPGPLKPIPKVRPITERDELALNALFFLEKAVNHRAECEQCMNTKAGCGVGRNNFKQHTKYLRELKHAESEPTKGEER